ncbi:MAG: hypothetical protein J2P15_21075 [Micromonosporaceae bacterium]|nr:hypothetical protein [Micromonosporaceae bacterium]
MIAALPLALPARNDFGDTQSDGLAGPTGLLIILLLVVATVFLIRNMNARLRRLPERFPQHVPDGHAQAGLRDQGGHAQAGQPEQTAGGADAVSADQAPGLDRAGPGAPPAGDETTKSSPA